MEPKYTLGLMPKPEPKLKRSNVMHALADDAITNPTLRTEKLVRDQEEKRPKAHLEPNESKKLTFVEFQ